LPILLLLVGGIVQYATIVATKHTLTQIGRDVGRWAATHPTEPCQDLALTDQPAIRADEVALESRLMGYTANTWVDNFTSYGMGPMPAAPASIPGAEVSWEIVDGTCPPDDSTTASYVTVRLTHRAPVLLPGLAYLPGLGTCDSSGCFLAISTTAKFRMEPEAQPPVTTP
jgi:Flp pilus assembly protein TadG